MKVAVLMAALSGYGLIAVRWGWVTTAASFAVGVVLGLAVIVLSDWRDERVRRQIRQRQDEYRLLKAWGKR